MFRMDTGTTLEELRALQAALQRVHDRRTGLVEATAQYGVNIVRERVQLEGKNADGETMLTSSAKRVGRYSESHGKVRQKEGLRTDIINLTFTGDLLNSESWTVLETDVDEYGAGFREEDMSKRAEYVEDLFGPVFQLSPAEEDEAAEYFNNAVSDLMTVAF